MARRKIDRRQHWDRYVAARSALPRVDRDAVEHSLNLLRHAFELRRPEAAEMAQRLLDEWRRSEISARRAAEWERRRQGGADTAEVQRLNGLADDKRARADAVQALIDFYRDHWLRPEDVGPLPHALLQPSRIAPVPEMHANGHLGLEHVRAANEIAKVAEAVTAVVGVRAAAIVGPSRGSFALRDFMPARIAEIWSTRYTPWTRALREWMGPQHGPRRLGLTLDVIIGGASLGQARARWRFGYDRAVVLIRDGLGDYAKRMDETALNAPDGPHSISQARP